MEQSLESRGGGDSAHDARGEQHERQDEPVTTETDQDDRQADELKADGARDDYRDQGDQGTGDGDLNEEAAEVLRTEASDAEQDVSAGLEKDNNDGKSNEIENSAMVEERDGDSYVENEASGEEADGAKGPSCKRSVQPMNEKKRSKSSEDEIPAGLPVTRVKRIIKLDPDIRLVSKEGIFAIIQATQHFLEALAADSASQAWKSNRKRVKADDIVAAARSSKFRDCLGTTLSDFVRHLREEESDGEDAEDGDSGDEQSEREETAGAVPKNRKGKDVKRKFLQPPPGNRSITDFLKAAV